MDFDQFLKEAASLFGLQWRLFRRRGIRRKVERRIAEIGLSHFDDYLLKIQKDPGEKGHLSKILTVTISRFFRDREVFDTLETSILPAILRDRKKRDLNIWSIGCANGEEPYSFALLWKEKFEKDFPEVLFSILATDIDEKMIERARERKYRKSSLREIPEEVLKRYFRVENQFYILNQSIQGRVEFMRHDIIHEEPFPGMDIIFCRNLAFTYFSKASQVNALKKIAASLSEKGYLVIGKDETLPLTYPTLFVPVFQKEKIFQRFGCDIF